MEEDIIKPREFVFTQSERRQAMVYPRMVIMMSGYPWLKLHHHVITMTMEIDAARLLLWLDVGGNTWFVELFFF